MKMRFRIASIRLASALVLIASSAFALDNARVEAPNGAPRIVVDGKPVRARMFWGGPGQRPIHVGAEGMQVAFQFSPPIDVAGKGTMHLRFGQMAGDVYVDDISVTDVATHQQVMPPCDFENGDASFTDQWTHWPTGKANTVGTIGVEAGAGENRSAGLHISLKNPPEGNWPDFHIYHHPNLTLLHDHTYRASLWLRADPPRDVTIAFYLPGKNYLNIGGADDVFAGQIKLAAAAGVRFISFPMQMPWPQPGGEADWSRADEVCQQVLAANPDAWLLPRIDVDAPAWWLAAHPQDAMAWDDAGPHQAQAVPASPAYRHDAAERLAALIEHLESKFGKSLVGYHPAGQNTNEWFYQDTWKRGLNGYARADAAGFRVWLTQAYKTDAALQSAWHNPAATLASADVPASARRRASPAGAFRDAATEQDIIDFADYQQTAMADCVAELAHAARTASGGKKLVVFFYGYQFEFAGVPTGPAVSGHYALRRLLDCPDIDLLCSPISYFDRGLGQSAPAMTAAESVALAGKMWLFEDDTHTYLATGEQPGWREHVKTLEETNQELLRNTGQCALRNFGTWWMDLGATGWFEDAGMWREMSALSELDQAMLAHPRAFAPEIAAVVDPRSMLLVTPAGAAASESVSRARQALGRVGAPYGQYLLDDVLAGRVKAKLYVFLNATRLTETERKRLLEATRGAGRVWCHAPGYIDDAKPSLDAVQQLCGFPVREISARAIAEPTEAGAKLGLSQRIGIDRPLKPLLSPQAPAEQVLAAYPDGSPAVALRRDADGASLFVGPPGLTSELLRLAAREAGAHLYTASDCNVYANGRYVILHAASDGEIQFDTAIAAPVRNMLTGESYGNGPHLSLKLKRGETRILDVGE